MTDLEYIEAASRSLDHVECHQVWFEDQPMSDMLADYEAARQYAIKHGHAHQEGIWLHREPGVSLRSEAEIAREIGSQGLEDVL